MQEPARPAAEGQAGIWLGRRVQEVSKCPETARDFSSWFIYLLENTDLSKPRHPTNAPALALPQERVRVGVSGR